MQNEDIPVAKKRQAPDADAVIDRLRETVGARTDMALGALFGLATSGVSNWRQRRRIPYTECVDVAIRKGVSLDWLVLGLGAGGAGTPGVAEPAVSYDDPRASRMIGFIQHWLATRDSDDMAWLERTLARTVPEYAEWLAAHKD